MVWHASPPFLLHSPHHQQHPCHFPVEVLGMRTGDSSANLTCTPHTQSFPHFFLLTFTTADPPPPPKALRSPLCFYRFSSLPCETPTLSHAHQHKVCAGLYVCVCPSYGMLMSESSSICRYHSQVKQIMEEAVTRKFVHEDSSHIVSFCGE